MVPMRPGNLYRLHNISNSSLFHFASFRSNQELRESVFELADRCLECRVDEQPNSKLKPKTKKMLRELLALGIPLKSLNVVVRRVLGDLGKFKVVGLPSLEEIEGLSAEYDDDDDQEVSG